MSSLEQNNNNLETSEAMNSKRPSVDRASSGSLEISNSSGLRKSKKKKKLGLFSFRSKKSSKVVRNVGEQNDTVSLSSEFSTTEEFTYAAETIVTEKQVDLSEANPLQRTEMQMNSETTLTKCLNDNIETTAQSNEDDVQVTANMEKITDISGKNEDESSITLVTPLSEDNSSPTTKYNHQMPESEGVIVQQLSKDKRDSSVENLSKTADIKIVKSEDSSSQQVNIPNRPNSIQLKTDNVNTRSTDTLSTRRQRMLVDQHSSSECSSYTISPIKKSKSKKGKMPPNYMATHQLKVRLLSGENLAARDSNGLSDPYVKFKIAKRTIHKSKICKATLNPRWSEKFTKMVKNSDKLSVMVYDYDLGRKDDFIGSSIVEIQDLIENEEVEVSLALEDQDADGEDLGFIHLALTKVPISDEVDSYTLEMKTSPEDVGDNISIASSKFLNERYSISRSDSNASDISRRTTMSITSNADMRNRKMLKTAVATATVQLVSGTGLPARDSNGLSDPYVKLNLGKQRHKSKVCYKTLEPVWKEEFVFQLTGRESLDRDSVSLDITVWDKDSYRKDDFIGRCEVDLSSLKYDETHKLSLNLIDAPGSIMLLVTLHSCLPSNVPINNYELSNLREKYSIWSTFKDLSDVGFVEVRIMRANGCRVADIGGKSDPFCVVELCNARAQTHTCYKTLDPVWDKTVTFPIKDIHDVLKLTVYDEDKDGEADFLGRLSIPLLRVKNGEERTYALKDRKLQNRSKGTITLQIQLIFNPVRGAIRTFNPRETNLMQQDPRFKRNLLIRNFHRVWTCVQAVLQLLEFVNSCFTWENPVRSATAFVVYLLIVWNIELYMVPILLVILLLKNYFAVVVQKTKVDRRIHDTPEEIYDDDDDEAEDQDSSERLSLVQRLNAIQEVLLKVQNILDWIASFLERIHNTFTWSVPYLSTLAVIVLCIVSIILYFISFRTIAILWGINKFTKRLRKPNYIPNNELFDFLSRIPSEIELDEYQELSITQGSPKGSKKKK